MKAMKRRSNQVRVLDPEQDRRLHLVAEAIASAGIPAATADILAEGFVARLRRRVYAALDDVIGDGDDLEALAGWQGPSRSLAEPLMRAGYVRDIGGILVMVDAVNEAPEYVKKRWIRQKPAEYRRAVGRCGQPNVASEKAGYTDGEDDPWDYEAEMNKESDMQDQGWLFGVEPDTPGEKHVATPGFREFCDYWHKRYQEVEGVRYPWGGRDNREVKQLLDRLQHDTSRAKLAAERFLACREARYAGHELRWLNIELPRWSSGGQSVGFAAKTDPSLRSQVPTGRGDVGAASIAATSRAPQRAFGSRLEERGRAGATQGNES